MFSELPRELRVMVVSFISPPKWKANLEQTIEWSQNLLACLDLPQVTVEFRLFNTDPEYGPNLQHNWEVNGNITVQRDTGGTYFYILRLSFEHWEQVKPIEHEIMASEDSPGYLEMCDLLNFCPREVTRLPPQYVVSPFDYIVGPRSFHHNRLQLMNEVAREHFGDFLSYRHSGVEAGPWYLLRAIGLW